MSSQLIDDVPASDWIALHDLVMGYAEAIDRKDWELFRALFAEDCVMTYGEPWGPIEGLDALTDFVAYFHAPLDSSRHGTTNFRVSSFDGSMATGRCSVDAMLVQGGRTLRVIGVYVDRFARRSGGWHFTERAFASIHSEGDPDVGAWDWQHPR